MALPLLAQCVGAALLSVLLSVLARYAWHTRYAVPATTPSWTVALHTLPLELQWRVLLHVAQPSLTRVAPHDSLGRVLCLSKRTLHTLQAAAYRDLYIHNAAALHRLRRTLAVEAPHLSAYIRSLHLASCGAASPLALEQLLLTVPQLDTLSLDASTAWRLCESQVGRLTHAARPKTVHLQWQVHPHTWPRLSALLQCRLWEHTRTLTMTSHVACAPLVASAPTWPQLTSVRWYAVPKSEHDVSWRIACAHATRVWEARQVHVVWEGICEAPT